MDAEDKKILRIITELYPIETSDTPYLAAFQVVEIAKKYNKELKDANTTADKVVTNLLSDKKQLEDKIKELKEDHAEDIRALEIDYRKQKETAESIAGKHLIDIVKLNKAEAEIKELKVRGIKKQLDIDRLNNVVYSYEERQIKELEDNQQKCNCNCQGSETNCENY